MAGPRRFQVDPRRVVHETVDGETILIQLETGTYYSLGGCGAEVWELLLAGWSDDEVADEMQRRHPASGEAVAEDTKALVRQLAQEELLDDREPDDGELAPVARGGAAADGQPYRPPSLQKYTDMQYFLLLDPIHEVEAAGWPHERAARARGG